MSEIMKPCRRNGARIALALAFAPSILLGTTACQVVAPEDATPHFTSKTYAMNKFVRHGFVVNFDPVIQERADVKWGPWRLTGLFNYDTEKGQQDERFGAFEFATPLTERLDFKVYYAYLHFSGFSELNKTEEIVAELTYDWWMKTSFFYLYDWDVGSGNLYELIGTRTFPFEGWSLTPRVMVGYNDQYFTTGSDFSHIEYKLTGDVPLNKHFSLSPFAAFSDGLNDGLGNHRIQDTWFGGLTLIAKF